MRVKPKYVAPLLGSVVAAASIAVAPIAAADGSPIQNDASSVGTGHGSAANAVGTDPAPSQGSDPFPSVPDGPFPLTPYGTQLQQTYPDLYLG